MSTTTEKLGLLKPELTDAADITSYNENWDKVDQAFKDAEAANNGKVSKGGDTVNGDLKINGALTVERSDNNRKARTVAHNNADKEVDFQNYGDDSNYVSLRVATETKGLGDAAKITQMKDGQFSSFTLLHTGNKEKIFTYGTEDIEAGTPSPYPNGTLHFVHE